MIEGYCDGCQRRTLLSPLHGPEKGGPLRCYVCSGEWHAAHGRRRQMGRVVIRAMRVYIDSGGSWDDIEKLKVTAHLGDFAQDLVVDPLGYMAETATTADQTVLLTSETLADALRLTHPDVHPPERRELANHVTRQLLALQPFVFPTMKPKPVTPFDPPRNTSGKVSGANLKEPSRSRYPCADCASTVPLLYCTPCGAEFERRGQIARDRERSKQREWYARRKARLARGKRPTPCAACGNEVRGKRKDARFCSGACRQRAHRTVVADKNEVAPRPTKQP
jgi:hypothetical protein